MGRPIAERKIYDARGETMSDKQRHLHPSRVNHKRPKWLEELSSPEAEEAIRKRAEEITKRYGYDPTASEVRAMMDQALGGRTLKEVFRELDDRFERELSNSEPERR